MGNHRLVAAAALAVALLPAGSAFAGAPNSNRTTFLLSRAADGGLPNGPSRNAAVSHDQRIARDMAYESDASNLVQGDGNGLTDVFVVHRAGPWGSNGTPWNIGQTEIASKGIGGQPANGRSYRPVLDGDSHHRASCVAFISDASNLVPGDTNGKADAFVVNLASHRITRVSVDSRGRQANGASYEVSADGDCQRAAFVSDASNLALKSAKKAAWKTARTSQTRPGVRQVYVHVLKGAKLDRAFTGLTFLASASRFGKAASGNSYHVGFARAGKAVVFDSDASNLAAGDHGAGTDVYERSFERHFAHVNGRGVQQLAFQTKLVSGNASGRAGNGASSHPSVSDDGRYVAFETLANNLAPGDTNGVSDVLEADLKGKHPKQKLASRSSFSGLGNGASNRPVISDAGEFVLFDSEATNLRPSASVSEDTNGVRDVFLWNRPSGNVYLESRDWSNSYLDSPSQNPATSARGNYVPFESANPSIDASMAARISAAPSIPPLIDPDAIVPSVAPPPGAKPELQQIYVRYLGPQ